MFQDLPGRIENNMHIDRKIWRKRKFYPMMAEELLHMSRNSTVGIMMALSMFKDSMPWIYDGGIEMLRTIKTVKTKQAKRNALREFEEIIEHSIHHPMMREFYMEEDNMLIKEMPRMIMRSIEQLMDNEKEG